MVEMALLAPLLFSIFFLIVDAGWWIYGYGTIYNATRRASEQATVTPPHTSKLVPNLQTTDACVAAIVAKATNQAQFFVGGDNDIRNGGIQILYPADGVRSSSDNDSRLRYVGGQIEVRITGRANWLTPLPTLFNLGDSFTVQARSRRSIEQLGFSPTASNNIICDP
jgi:hypothetical protein